MQKRQGDGLSVLVATTISKGAIVVDEELGPRRASRSPLALLVRADFTRSMRGRNRGSTNSARELPEYRAFLGWVIVCYFRFFAEASVSFHYQHAWTTQP